MSTPLAQFVSVGILSFLPRALAQAPEAAPVVMEAPYLWNGDSVTIVQVKTGGTAVFSEAEDLRFDRLVIKKALDNITSDELSELRTLSDRRANSVRAKLGADVTRAEILKRMEALLEVLNPSGSRLQNERQTPD